MPFPRHCWRTFVRFSELDGATVGVWGAGREIRSFAGHLARRLPAARIAVAAFDEPPSEDIPAVLRARDVRVVTGPGGGPPRRAARPGRKGRDRRRDGGGALGMRPCRALARRIGPPAGDALAD